MPKVSPSQTADRAMAEAKHVDAAPLAGRLLPNDCSAY